MVSASVKSSHAPRALLRGRPAGVGLAGEAAVRAQIERRGGEDGDAGMRCRGLFRDGFGGIGRIVVDDDQLPLGPECEAVVGLREQRCEAGRKIGCFVASGDDDGEAQRRRGEFVWIAGSADGIGHRFVL